MSRADIMFIIVLRLTEQKAAAKALMPGHNAWIRRGFDDGVFVLMGGLSGAAGGVLLARDATREAVERRVADDPLVAEGVAVAEILEVAVKRVEPSLQLLGATS